MGELPRCAASDMIMSFPHIARPCADSVFSNDPQPLGDMLGAKQQEDGGGPSSGEYLQKLQWRSLDSDPRYQHGAHVRSTRILIHRLVAG